MITPERYEVIKKFGNVLFMFHQKQASPENKEKLKKLLKKMVLTKEFHWSTNQLTKEVTVTFWLGKMTITVGKDHFLVHIDDQTRENLKKYSSQQVPDKKPSVITKVTPQPIVNPSLKPQMPSSAPNSKNDNKKMVNSFDAPKDKYLLAQEEAFHHYEEKEKNVSNATETIKKPIETKGDATQGEPLFLGFLSEGDYAM